MGILQILWILYQSPFKYDSTPAHVDLSTPVASISSFFFSGDELVLFQALVFAPKASSLKATLITYNSAIKACGNAGVWQQALQLLNLMTGDGWKLEGSYAPWATILPKIWKLVHRCLKVGLILFLRGATKKNGTVMESTVEHRLP